MAISSSSALSHFHAVCIARVSPGFNFRELFPGYRLSPRRYGANTPLTTCAVTGIRNTSKRHSIFNAKSFHNFHSRCEPQLHKLLSHGALLSVALKAAGGGASDSYSNNSDAVDTERAEEGGREEEGEEGNDDEGSSWTATRCAFESEVVEEFVRLNDGDWHGSFLVRLLSQLSHLE